MNRQVINNILLLSYFFEKRASLLTEYSPLTNPLKLLLNNYILTDKEVIDWIKNNKTVLDKFTDGNWYYSNKIIRNYYDIYEVRISNDKSLLNSSSEIGTAILYGTTNIPTMWLSIIDNKNVIADKDLAHNYFIVETLGELFRVYVKNPNDVNNILNFINENKNKIDKIKSLFSGRPQLLGHGADGVAFKISPTLVLKVFKDSYAYKTVQQAMDRLHKNPNLAKTEAMIYDVGILGEFNNQTLYYYIIELMKSLSDVDPSRTVSHNLHSIILSLASQIYNDKKWKDLKSKSLNEDSSSLKKEMQLAARNMAEQTKVYLSDYISNIERLVPSLRESWLKSLAEELIMKYITGRVDLHIGNIGLTNYGEFRYFDPAYISDNTVFNI